MISKILTTTAILAVAASAYAGGEASSQDASVSAFENLYITGTAGYSKSMKLKGDFGKNNMKNSAIFGFGVKTDLTDAAKVGLAFEYRPGYKLKNSESKPVGSSSYKVTESLKGKAKIATLMLNATYDLYNFEDTIYPYVEVAAGLARVKTSGIEWKTSSTAPGSTSASGVFKAKTYYNPAYSVGLGAKFKIDENANLLFGYKFSDFGKTKAQKQDFSGIVNDIPKAKIRSNDLLLTLEYKL